ncbi:hypothetical protein HHL17_06025 [Chitinophaga sp. G-6-1-13]|uniref:Uncharacterized protein n=1 Tax=Chitinophaga fulva TaxID=2728842 RepID=A0A848GI61_9BACT|nr:hypothetical protein [Chitinophaga fulva]NML36752.1 hypothetical protein [Chitinophaga fulva]
MKTSNKLLLGFFGSLVLLMLCTDIVLRANFANGITNSTFGKRRPAEQLTTITLQPFQVVKILSASGHPQYDTLNETRVRQARTLNGETTSETTVRSTWASGFINIVANKNYTLTKDVTDSVLVSYAADTLILTVFNASNLELKAPSITQVIAPSSHVRINNYQIPSLTITAGPNVEAYVNNNQVGTLSFSGGQGGTLLVNEETTADSVNIALGKGSKLHFKGAYQRGHIQVDSLQEIELSEKVLQKIKEIK